MINAASPDLSSKTCGSVRAHATDRRWKTGFDFHRRPGVRVGATGALLRDCHQNSWVIFKWPNSGINPFVLAWLHLCLRYTQAMGGKEKRERERITSESQKGLALGVQTRCTVENKPLCTNSSKANQRFCLQPHTVWTWTSTRLVQSKCRHLPLTLFTHWVGGRFHTPPGHLFMVACVSEANVHLQVI